MSSVFVEAEVDIKRSPEDVFDFCSDPIHEPEWNPMMKRVVKLTDGPGGIGARVSISTKRTADVHVSTWHAHLDRASFPAKRGAR